ncbi:methyltransferase-like protein 14 [Endogone sp. FLAS-F59071]|nr:methyltransferase-like protein 14 [Endogone sp. FLAS-F59071]|eukprot:RUS19974.1 methyltransferase-like protein 14 [Endogone sp. FLAS-F59071]
MTPSLRSREERNATLHLTHTMPPTDEIEHIKRQRRQLSSLITERQRRRLHKLQSLQTVTSSGHSLPHQTDKESESARARAKRRRTMDKPPPVVFEDIQGPQRKGDLAKEAGSQEKKGAERSTGAATEAEDEQSRNSIRNDYSQNFVDSGQRPHNYIRDSNLKERFDEYPKLKELTKLKNELVESRSTPPAYLKADLRNFELKSLQCKFDVILIDPPLEEYCRRSPMTAGKSHDYWAYEEIASLKIEEIAANPSFIWIWVGDSEGLDRGRQLLTKWGYRRCEDIVWIKTNRSWEGSHFIETRSVLQHTKEHCLMGIKGTVRRSTDGHFIHCNVDTDVIISEEPPLGSTRKPEELYHIIEHFCLGRRRLELFGEDHNIRRGWLTIGNALSSSNFSAKTYNSYFSGDPNGYLLGSTPKIEELRPKSPPPPKNGKNTPGGQGKKGKSAAPQGSPMGPPPGPPGPPPMAMPMPIPPPMGMGMGPGAIFRPW